MGGWHAQHREVEAHHVGHDGREADDGGAEHGVPRPRAVVVRGFRVLCKGNPEVDWDLTSKMLV